MLVLVNPRASYGRARKIWSRVAPEIERRAPGVGVEEIASAGGVPDVVRRAYESGERAFVAAGGDGMVNLVLNAIVALDDGADATLGAIGLGSSNDFHKPFGPGNLVDGVPVRIDCEHARPRDVIRIEYEDHAGRRATRYALMNASLGITAEANAGFNEPTRLIRMVRRVSVDAAILASVLATVATYRDIPCRLWIDEREEGTISVSNLGIVKSPHFAGSFCYDSPVEPDDGRLGVNLCERLTPFQVFATLAALRRRRFRGRPKTRSWIGRTVRVEADRGFALEADGEIVRAREAAFSVLPRAVRVCA